MTPHRTALEHLRSGDWRAAHEIVQSMEDANACWLHAVVHRMEGDLGNARYWYRRAQIGFDPSLALEEELNLIEAKLAP